MDAASPVARMADDHPERSTPDSIPEGHRNQVFFCVLTRSVASSNHQYLRRRQTLPSSGQAEIAEGFVTGDGSAREHTSEVRWKSEANVCTPLIVLQQ